MLLSSYTFFAFAAFAIAALTLTRGPLRAAIFLALNAAFAWTHLDTAGAISVGVLVFGAWLAARALPSAPSWATGGAVAIFVAAFVWLRDYPFLAWILPEGLRAHGLFPAGGSFLFFRLLHVVIDAGAGRLGALPLVGFTNYCLAFTTFLLGPIQRYPDFARQWSGAERAIEPSFEAHLDAVLRIARGLVKKFVLAELLGPHVLQPGLDLAAFSPGALLLMTWGFYLFLYFDFSGYCDIVIGVGSLMGVRPPENFDLPFLSRNVADYWLRVHRSLTLWLTDYVFQPAYAAALRRRLLGGGFGALALALVATMLVSGLWHGTTLSFLVFGALHALYLVAFRGYERIAISRLGRAEFARFSRRPWVRAAAVLLTFQVTSLAYAAFVLDADQLWLFARRLVGAA
jgi:D-alanyl-lipoteichoic acid acyltransferase DltB (MBOAT superfamily)